METPTILYTKETRGMITLITRARVMLTLLTREPRECRGHVRDLLTIT